MKILNNCTRRCRVVHKNNKNKKFIFNFHNSKGLTKLESGKRRKF